MKSLYHSHSSGSFRLGTCRLRKALLAPIIPTGCFSSYSYLLPTVPLISLEGQGPGVWQFVLSLVLSQTHFILYGPHGCLKMTLCLLGHNFKDVQTFFARLVQSIFLHCCRFLYSRGSVGPPSSVPAHSLQVFHYRVFYTHLCSPVGHFISLSHGDHISTCGNAYIAPDQ